MVREEKQTKRAAIVNGAAVEVNLKVVKSCAGTGICGYCASVCAIWHVSWQRVTLGRQPAAQDDGTAAITALATARLRLTALHQESPAS